MALFDITERTAVLQAAQEFDVLGRDAFLARYGFGRARDYFLLLDGKRYDSKAIMGAAHGYQFPHKGPLRAADFSGGEATVKARLEQLGFGVESPTERPVAPQSPPQTENERRLDGDNLDLHKITEELNAKAQDHPIGGLQAMRVELKSMTRRPWHVIFSPASTAAEFAFHHGGRRELQFNIGFEMVAGVREFRHGIAFSFETSQSMPIVDELFPKVSRFNDFLRQDLESFADLRMWHFDHDERSGDYLPGPIPSQLARKGVFVFLGKRQPADQPIDYESALLNFDRLLPLYRYVESPGESKAFQGAQFTFRPGCSIKAASANCTHAELQLDIALRHNEMQRALYERLAVQYGEDNVGTECPSIAGTRVDVVVRDGPNWSYYEIKTSHSPRTCIREAVGQLLEYSFWPGCQKATRLVVVGETPLDDDGAVYLTRLKQQFALPLEYESIAIPNSGVTT